MNVFKKCFQNVFTSRHFSFDRLQKKNGVGFTLIELLVVLGIIGLFASIVFASMGEARKNTRDKTRLVDIKQIQLAVEIFREATNAYPSPTGSDAGLELGLGGGAGTIDDLLSLALTKIPKDPKSDGSTYKYVYDTSFNCTAPNQKVIYINNFETLTSQANADTECGTDTDDATSNQYIIIIE